MLDAIQVQDILPHRYPFLFIDRVVEVGETTIVAQKMVSNSDPILQGHFPGNPILPGVVQVVDVHRAVVADEAHVRSRRVVVVLVDD